MTVDCHLSAEAHLAKLNVAVGQAKDFILSNIAKPALIYEVAWDNGVTTDMLSEICGVDKSIVLDYFSGVDLDGNKLDGSRLLIGHHLGSLEHFVDFNDRAGKLSNTSLAEKVKGKLAESGVYDFTFGSIFDFQDDDGIYDGDELGVCHLENVPATNESLESLFYGSLINVFLALDQAEYNKIIAFSKEEDPNGYQTLLISSLAEAPATAAWTDEELAENVSTEAATIIDTYWFDNPLDMRGVLEFSYLGFAIG